MPETPERRHNLAGANAPAVVIRLTLESAPIVYVDTLNESEELRLTDWITEARPEYGALVARALELAAGERAA
jgi:hypothetical protein